MLQEASAKPARIGETLMQATAQLAKLAHTSPRLEAELLLSEATGWSRTRLIAWPEQTLDPVAATRFETLLQRRLSGEPIAYIRARQAFWTFELKVSPATLIPRPETELLVETALALLTQSTPLRIADLGTGSGAIAAALASERPEWHIIATDHSLAALRIARENFNALGLRHISTLACDWLAAIGPASFDAILGNPPYIAAGDAHLGRGDLRFEPRAALSSGDDGLDAIRTLARDAPRCLRQHGLLMVEHGFDQGQAVRALFHEHGLRDLETRQDLAGLDRITLGRR